MTAFETMQKHYEQRDLAARQWKRRGGKVVGYFCTNVPEEIISAAGFFPLRLSGDPNSGTEMADQYSSELGPPEGFVGSMLNMILTGKYDFVDFLIIPYARDSIHFLYRILCNIKQSKSEPKLPELYFLDNLHTMFLLSQSYNRDRIIDLKQRLEKWSEKEISDESISRAIAISNENKVLLKKVAALRKAEPSCISGVEALQVIGSSMFMLKEDHNKLLKKFLADEVDKLHVRNGVRLFIEGSPLDNLQLYEIIESCNATVVAEDNCWGNRYFDFFLDTSLNPLEAIVDSYNNKPPCPRMYPLSRRVGYCVNNALEAKAQGAILNVLEFDNVQTWETPAEIKALKEKYIPLLHLKRQPYLIADSAVLKASIGKFIETIQ